ncbi:adenylylsulfate kinase [Aureococcus anophagefferens]|nr:adenylylsulfate kinase [Aureococcus anophagefferens]
MGAYDDDDGAVKISKSQLFIGGISIVLCSLLVLSRSNGTLACSNPGDFDIGAYREAALANTPPNIIECAGAEAGGGSGKSTIAGALEERLVLEHGKVVQMLDGDNVRTGLNRDLGFSPSDRGERRVGELACLFNAGGVITLVTLVSPYRADRDAAKARHGDMGLKFLEVKAGEITSFTGMSEDAPYEMPLHPDIDLPNNEMTIDESVDMLMEILTLEGVLVGN